MTRRERRVLQIGAMIIVALLLIRGAPAAWSWRTQLVADVDARAELLTRMRFAVGRLPDLEADAGFLRDELAALAPQLLEGGTASAAAAALSLRLNSVADRHLVRVVAEEPLRDSVGAGALQSVRLRLSIEGDARGVLETVSALAAEPPVTDVLALSVAAADPASPPGVPEVLRGELLLRGWYLRSRE